MNTIHGRARFNNFQIILNSECSSTIVMGRLVEKVHPKKDHVTQWHTQAENITTNHKVNVDFTLPALSTTNSVTWKCHANEYAKGRYDMMKWHTQAVNITTNHKVKVYFTLPQLSATNFCDVEMSCG